MAFDINIYPDNCDIWNRYIELIVIKNIYLKPDWCSIIEYKKNYYKQLWHACRRRLRREIDWEKQSCENNDLLYL